jgi:hypothetical protein
MKSPSLEASEASTPSFPCWEWFKGKSQKLWFIALNCFRISSKFSLEPIHSYHSYIKIHEKNYKSSEIHPLILHFFYKSHENGRALKDESFGNFSLALPAFAKAGPELLAATATAWRMGSIQCEAPVG